MQIVEILRWRYARQAEGEGERRLKNFSLNIFHIFYSYISIVRREIRIH